MGPLLVAASCACIAVSARCNAQQGEARLAAEVAARPVARSPDVQLRDAKLPSRERARIDLAVLMVPPGLRRDLQSTVQSGRKDDANVHLSEALGWDITTCYWVVDSLAEPDARAIRRSQRELR